MDTPTSCACPSACAVPLVVHRRRLQVLEMALRPGHLLFVVLTVVCSTAAVLGAMGAAHGDTLAFGAILVGASSSLAVPPADHNALFPPPPAGTVDWSGPYGGEEPPPQLSPGPSE